MKIALLGAGKTGIEVTKLHANTVIFNTQNIPTLSKIKECDIVISFLAGDIFLRYIPLLIEAKLPVVTGSTGFQWPSNIHEELKEKKLVWVCAHNFSLGMNIVKSMIKILSKSSHLYDHCNYNILDIHHTKKLDAPSGTALSWQKWLGTDATIESQRTGDVIGYHEIEMDSALENIKVIHNAKDRAIFASGALWCADKLYNNLIETGLNDFSEVVSSKLNI
jgi:4-hydroxy-tetrahydrodipicolinate reductase